MYAAPRFPDPAALADPEAFLASAAGELWVSQLAEEFPHTRYWRDRSDCWSLKQLNSLAARIIDARYDGKEVDEAMEAEFPPSDFRDSWYQMVVPDLRRQIRASCPAADDDVVLDAFREAWQERAADKDESSVSDLFASYDRCELLFRFSQHRWLDDCLVHSHRPWSEPAALGITENLQFALNKLGYTIGEFRKASRNRRAAEYPLPRHLRRRREPIIAMEQLVELIDNVCSTSFMFTLYAIVPIPDLIGLDFTKPVTFDKCWVASMDPINGTFHDVPAAGPVRVNPADGRFLAGGSLRWSPDDICGLHTPHYHASVRN